MYDARAVANFLLDYADRQGMHVTLLWLLKVIYYAHGWHLNQRQQPLISQSFEAWEHGPVVRVVYDAFKGRESAPIIWRAKRFNVIENRLLEIHDDIEPVVKAFLENVIDAYAHISATDLSQATHSKGSPWDRVWNAPNGQISIGMKISNEYIRTWFSEARAAGVAH